MWYYCARVSRFVVSYWYNIYTLKIRWRWCLTCRNPRPNVSAINYSFAKRKKIIMIIIITKTTLCAQYNIYIGVYIVNKRGSFILTFPRQIFSSQQHPLFITRSPFRSVYGLSLSLLFISSLFFLSHFFLSGYYCYPRQSSVHVCVGVCVFCVSVYRHVFINPHIPRRCRRRRRQPYTASKLGSELTTTMLWYRSVVLPLRSHLQLHIILRYTTTLLW